MTPDVALMAHELMARRNAAVMQMVVEQGDPVALIATHTLVSLRLPEEPGHLVDELVALVPNADAAGRDSWTREDLARYPRVEVKIPYTTGGNR